MLFGTNSNPFFIIAKHVYTLQLFWLDCNRLRTKQFVGRRLLKSPSSCPAGRSWCGTSAANFIVHTFLGSKSVKNDSESGLHIKHQEFIHIFQQVHYMTIYIYIILWIHHTNPYSTTYQFWKRPSLLCFWVCLTSWGLGRATMAPSNSVPFPVLMVVGLKASPQRHTALETPPSEDMDFWTGYCLCLPLIQKYNIY